MRERDKRESDKRERDKREAFCSGSIEDRCKRKKTISVFERERERERERESYGERLGAGMNGFHVVLGLAQVRAEI